MPAERTITGDYDNDDYESGHLGDADNDDSAKPKDVDNDFDGKGHGLYDKDDGEFSDLGHAASGAQRSTIAALVVRYFALAAAEDGAAACPMVLPSLANGVPEEFGRSPSPPYMRGTTCAVVLSKLFRLNHRQVAVERATLKIADVRVDHDRGFALLRFKGLPNRFMPVTLVAGAWKMGGLLEEELP
jgi:hypothetical protein